MDVDSNMIATSSNDGEEDAVRSTNEAGFVESQSTEVEEQQPMPDTSMGIADSAMDAISSADSPSSNVQPSSEGFGEEGEGCVNSANDGEFPVSGQMSPTTTSTMASNMPEDGLNKTELPSTTTKSVPSQSASMSSKTAASLAMLANTLRQFEKDELKKEEDRMKTLAVVAEQSGDNDDEMGEADVSTNQNLDADEESEANLDLDQENLATLAEVSTGNLAPMLEIPASSVQEENQSAASSTSTSEITSTLLTLGNAAAGDVQAAMISPSVSLPSSVSSANQVNESPMTSMAGSSSSLRQTVNDNCPPSPSNISETTDMDAQPDSHITSTTTSSSLETTATAAPTGTTIGSVTTPVSVAVSTNISSDSNTLPSPLLAMTSTSNMLSPKPVPSLIASSLTPTTTASSSRRSSSDTPGYGSTGSGTAPSTPISNPDFRSPQSDKRSGTSCTSTDTDEGDWHTVGIFQGLNATVNSYIDNSVWSSDNKNLTSNDLPDLSGFPRINLEPGTTYRFRIRAINTVGASNWSEVSNFKTCLPGFPGAPSAIKISKSAEGAHLTWEPPSSCIDSSEIIEYSVYLAVKPNKDKESKSPQQQQQQPRSASQLAFVRVYVGAAKHGTVPHISLGAAHVDYSNKPAIIFRIAARNDKGYGPATQVRWLQDTAQQNPLASPAISVRIASPNNFNIISPSCIKPELQGSPSSKRFKASSNRYALQ